MDTILDQTSSQRKLLLQENLRETPSQSEDELALGEDSIMWKTLELDSLPINKILGKIWSPLREHPLSEWVKSHNLHLKKNL